MADRQARCWGKFLAKSFLYYSHDGDGEERQEERETELGVGF